MKGKEEENVELLVFDLIITLILHSPYKKEPRNHQFSLKYETETAAKVYEKETYTYGAK